MTAKFAGRCRECGDRIEKGDSILWGRNEGARHEHCPSPEPSHYDDSDYDEPIDPQIARDEADYQQGVAEAQQYLDNKRMYGAELAEQWEMEAELARYNRGEDW
jgi:hypothetical protein